jgi:lipopolysaccharide heptosyltransferase I
MKRILIIKMSSLGDLLHALPAVHLIKQHTGAAVDWVVHDIYAELAGCFTDVERVIAFPRRNFWRQRAAFVAELRQERYDLALDMQGLLKSALVMRSVQADRRIGPSFSREGSRLFYDAVSGPRNKKRHAVEENLDTVRFLGIPMGPVEFPVRFPKIDLAGPRPRVGLLPCSRRADKNWPPERFAEVARALRENTEAHIVLLGSPADRPVCDALARSVGAGVTNLCGKTTMLELGGAVRALDLLITVDSGPMHVAAAVGTPTVAVFGPTDPVKTGPYGPLHRVVQQGEDLARLPAAPVIEAALAALATIRKTN